MASLQDMASGYGLLSYPGSQLFPPADSAAPVAAPVAAQVAPMPDAPPGPEQLLAMMQKYQGGPGTYATELAAARQKSEAETQAFQDLLKQAMETKTESGPSKAEMYFRLAAAFGTPGKTGSFFENLGQAGAVMAQYGKEEREAAKANRAQRLQLGLQAQQARMAGAKEDLGTLRQLAAEEMRDKRAVASKLLEQYIQSGQPQSSAGKQARDEGLRPGTPEFQKRVGQIAEMNIDRQMAQINATLAGLSLQQANAALAQQKFGFQQEQAAKLTPGEVKLKTETEDLLAQTAQAYDNLKLALALNPNTYDASTADTSRRKLLEAAGSKDTKLKNTREMENLLEKVALSQLKATFPGAISNDERKALMDTQGLSAKSVEERERIMQNAQSAMKAIYARAKRRLNEINQGLYRETSMPGEAE